jgi:hypothetical protein
MNHPDPIKNLFADPQFVAELFAGLDDDVFHTVANALTPVQLTQAQLDRSWAGLRALLEPPPSLLAWLGRGGRRLAGSSLARLREFVAPVEEAHAALSACLRPAPGHLAGGPDHSALALASREVGAEVTHDRACTAVLCWSPEGRLSGEIRVAPNQLDQLDSLEPWKTGWFLIHVEDRPLVCGPFNSQADDHLLIPVDEPAPTHDLEVEWRLPAGKLKITLIQASGERPPKPGETLD